MPGEPPLGLIAGEGVFPLLVARGAHAAGRKVVCAGLAGCVWPAVADEVDSFRPVGVLRLGQWARFLRKHGAAEAVMVGRVKKADMYRHGRFRRWMQYRPDLRTVALYLRHVRHDKRDHALLGAIADDLARDGITLIDSTRYTPDHLATAGVMTRRAPTPRQLADIEFGWELCRTVSRLDIGQSVAVVDKDVIAVEAVEGTDAMIRRAGELCRTKGWTLLKVANARADMRFDVPSVGVTTIQRLADAGAGCLVLEAGKTILLEKQKVLALADAKGIAVVGRAGGP